MTFDDQLKSLASLAGVRDAEFGDEHVRWEVYQKVVDLAEARDQLRAALRLEPVLSLAAAVVVLAFEHVPVGERAGWVGALKEEVRAFPERRMAELEILEACRAGELAPASVDLDEWSDWLQRRVAQTATDLAVLELLAERGRTKAIRAAATERRQ